MTQNSSYKNDNNTKPVKNTSSKNYGGNGYVRWRPVIGRSRSAGPTGRRVLAS